MPYDYIYMINYPNNLKDLSLLNSTNRGKIKVALKKNISRNILNINYWNYNLIIDSYSKKKNKDFEGKIVIAPPSALKDKWSRRFSEPVICYASGWMSIKQRAKQSLVEIPLIISDHCDWNELTATIKKCKTKTVWVTHGREDALVYWCRKQDINAKPLYMQGREEEQ